jgi:hypothetical protein
MASFQLMSEHEYRTKVVEALMRLYGVKKEDAFFSTRLYDEHIQHGLRAPDYDFHNRGKLRDDYPEHTARRIWNALSANYFIVMNAATKPTPPRRIS